MRCIWQMGISIYIIVNVLYECTYNLRVSRRDNKVETWTSSRDLLIISERQRAKVKTACSSLHSFCMCSVWVSWSWSVLCECSHHHPLHHSISISTKVCHFTSTLHGFSYKQKSNVILNTCMRLVSSEIFYVTCAYIHIQLSIISGYASFWKMWTWTTTTVPPCVITCYCVDDQCIHPDCVLKCAFSS